jgi:hypothetical protein
VPTESDWEGDYNTNVLTAIEGDRCAFLMYRLDTRNSNGFDWIFISYSPDYAAVRDKMVYASTRASVSRMFSRRTRPVIFVALRTYPKRCCPCFMSLPTHSACYVNVITPLPSSPHHLCVLRLWSEMLQSAGHPKDASEPNLH